MCKGKQALAVQGAVIRGKVRPNPAAVEGFLHVPRGTLELNLSRSWGISSRQTHCWGFPKYVKALDNSKRASTSYTLLDEKAHSFYLVFFFFFKKAVILGVSLLGAVTTTKPLKLKYDLTCFNQKPCGPFGCSLPSLL